MTDVFIEVEKVEEVEIVLTAVTGGLPLRGTVENSDVTYSDTVASGSTLVLPDINITKNDGTVVTSPSVKDLDLRVIDPPVSFEAQLVYSLMPNPLTDTEKDNIAEVVDTMVASGNWSKLDYLFNRALIDPANALTSWKGIKTGANVNGCLHSPGKGYIGNGTTQYIDNNIKVSTDLVNATLNNIHAESYCYENLDSNNGRFMFGMIDTAGTDKRLSVNQGAPMAYSVNAATDDVYAGGALFLNNTRYGLHRANSADHQLYVNGVQVDSDLKASSALGIHNIYSLSRNVNGAPSNFINARESYFLVGGGFDLVALDTEMDLLETLFII
jgi:hypothetical protein